MKRIEFSFSDEGKATALAAFEAEHLRPNNFDLLDNPHLEEPHPDVEHLLSPIMKGVIYIQNMKNYHTTHTTLNQIAFLNLLHHRKSTRIIYDMKVL